MSVASASDATIFPLFFIGASSSSFAFVVAIAEQQWTHAHRINGTRNTRKEIMNQQNNKTKNYDNNKLHDEHRNECAPSVFCTIKNKINETEIFAPSIAMRETQRVSAKWGAEKSGKYSSQRNSHILLYIFSIFIKQHINSFCHRNPFLN